MTKTFFSIVSLLYAMAGVLTIGSMIVSLFVPVAAEHVVRTTFSFLMFGGAIHVLSVALRAKSIYYSVRIGVVAFCGVGMAFVLSAFPDMNPIIGSEQNQLGWIGTVIVFYGIFMAWHETDLYRLPKMAISA